MSNQQNDNYFENIRDYLDDLDPNQIKKLFDKMKEQHIKPKEKTYESKYTVLTS
mgnify:FL=1